MHPKNRLSKIPSSPITRSQSLPELRTAIVDQNTTSRVNNSHSNSLPTLPKGNRSPYSNGVTEPPSTFERYLRYQYLKHKYKEGVSQLNQLNDEISTLEKTLAHYKQLGPKILQKAQDDLMEYYKKFKDQMENRVVFETEAVKTLGRDLTKKSKDAITYQSRSHNDAVQIQFALKKFEIKINTEETLKKIKDLIGKTSAELEKKKKERQRIYLQTIEAATRIKNKNYA